MRVGVLAVCLAVAGCDRVLQLAEVPPPLAAAASNIAAADAHTCWIRSDGGLWCWGRNSEGQLGAGGNAHENATPNQIGDAKWKVISGTNFHTCGIQQDDSLWCWGDNFAGQLGTGDTTASHVPVGVRPGQWKAVAAGHSLTCAIEPSGNLWCWGANDTGALPCASDSNQRVTSPCLIGADYRAVTAGDDFACAIANDDTALCFGAGGNGQIGDGTYQDATTPTPVMTTDTWLELAAGYAAVCGITKTRKLRCWGDDYTGELGQGTRVTSTTPNPVLIDGVDRDDWVGLTMSGEHACAWNTKHEVYCSGDNSHGELGDNAVPGRRNNPTPVRVGEGHTWAAFAVGIRHACGLDDAGVLWCAGGNDWGQLGNGTDTIQLAPQRVTPPPGASTWALVAAGYGTSCAQDVAGSVWCGGWNYSGQLGTGGATDADSFISTTSLVPLPAPPAPNHWVEVKIGDQHACARDSAHVPYCWGTNYHGEVGLGPNVGDATAPAVATSGTYDLIVASDHTCVNVLGPSNTLSCWGPNDHDQLTSANSDPTYMRSPPITGMVGATVVDAWQGVAAGDGFTCARDGSGDVLCWGLNADGEIGTGVTSDIEPLPVVVNLSGGAPLVALTFARGTLEASGTHVCALDSSQLAYCWGYEPDVGPQPVPKQVSTTAYRQLALGSYHACGIRADTGALECWGDDFYGQLGVNDVDRGYSNAPVAVVSPCASWSDVAAGGDHTCAVCATDGQLYCWGSNHDGELLDGKAWTTTLAPVMAP